MSKGARYITRVQNAACVLLVLAITSTGLGRNRTRNRNSLNPVFSISDGTVWKLHPWGAWLDGFDISPDGLTFAAEFTALQAEKRAALWVGEWNMATGKLVGERPIEGPILSNQLGVLRILDLRFASDGRRLIALTGTKVVILDALTLKTLYSIDAAKIQPPPQNGVVIRQIPISSDGKVLAVISSGVGFPWGPINVRVFNIQAGGNLADWNFTQEWSNEFSLSPTGNKMLVSHSQWGDPTPPDVLLVDARTGAVMRTFDSRFGSRKFGYWGYAQFIDQNSFLVASIGASHHALNIVNLQTGKVMQELGESKHDAQAWAVAATGSPVIAALVFSWKRGIGTDLDFPFKRGIDWLGIFRIGQQEPLYVRRMVPLYQGEGPSFPMRSTIRLSPDGKLLAFGSGRVVRVFNVDAR